MENVKIGKKLSKKRKNKLGEKLKKKVQAIKRTIVQQLLGCQR